MNDQKAKSFPSTLDIRCLCRWYISGGDVILFLAIWIVIALFIGQDRIIEKYSFQYWLIVLPPVVLPLLRAKQTLWTLLRGTARPVAAFGIVSALWLIYKGDYSPIPPLFLIVWVTGWCVREEIRIRENHLHTLACLFFCTAVVVFAAQRAIIASDETTFAWMKVPPIESAAADPQKEEHAELLLPNQHRPGMDFNPWGVLPGQTLDAFGDEWRISATPKISTSALFSMFLLMIFARRRPLRPMPVAAGLAAAYFAVLSFVRAVFISLGLFLATWGLLRLVPEKPAYRLAVSIASTIGLIACVWLAPALLFRLQDHDLISRLLLRGQTGLSEAEIYRQLYRPWLWLEHMKLFWNSDLLMGVGSDIAKSAQSNLLNANQVRSDADSFLTRLIAVYGLPVLGLLYFFARRALAFAKSGDTWAIAVLSVSIWLMMTWGSSFHPSNGVFVLAFMFAGLGSRSFEEE